MKVLHLLNWKLESIIKELPNIKRQGFDSIQINPMQPFKEEKIFHWWSSYQPLGFRIGNMFGTKEDLKKLCNEAKKYNINIIVDVIANHTANYGANKELIPHPTVDKILLVEKDYWKQGVQMRNGDNRYDATHNMIGLPGLNLKNKELQQIIFNYLEELKKCGVKGYRFDAAKHIGLPNDGVDFFENVSEYLKNNNLIGYGEFLGGNKEWRDEISKYLIVLTPASTTITDQNKLICFYESHDTFLNDTGHTRDLTTTELKIYYKLLRMLYENSICYVRPLNINNNPYIKNENNLNIETVYKLNEKDYFNTFYIDDKEIEQINKLNKIEDIIDNTKKKILVRK